MENGGSAKIVAASLRSSIWGSPMKKRKPKTTKHGTVQKIIKPSQPGQPEKVEIAIEGADDLYREIRIENALEDEEGKEVGLTEGADVDVTVEAAPKATKPKENNKKAKGAR